MSLKLILMRHAKSGWDNLLLQDHERSLTDRGRRASVAIGDWLARQGYVPNAVQSSDSTRTRETWDRLSGAFASDIPVTWSEALYHASAQVILDRLRRATGDTVMVIAHNPGIAQFAEMILSKSISHPRFRDYPTAATLVVEFEVAAWDQVDWGKGIALDFVVPKDLETQ